MSNPDVKRQTDMPWEGAVEAVQETLGELLPTRNDLIRFEPKIDWFTNGLAEDHEGDHLGRVLVLGEMLARVLIVNGKVDSDINREAISWGAVFHDTQINGVDYLEHGRAAANWVEENWPEERSPEMMKLVKYLCKWHVSGDREIPEMIPELAVLKDVDSLDRVRFPFLDNKRLDISYLRFEVSKSLMVPVAMRLFELTDKGYASAEEGFDAAIEAGVEMGLIRA